MLAICYQNCGCFAFCDTCFKIKSSHPYNLCSQQRKQIILELSYINIDYFNGLMDNRHKKLLHIMLTRQMRPQNAWILWGMCGMRLQYVEYTENLSKSLTVYEIRVYGEFYITSNRKGWFLLNTFWPKNVSKKERGQIYSSKTLEALKKYVPSSLTIISLCERQMQAR